VRRGRISLDARWSCCGDREGLAARIILIQKGVMLEILEMARDCERTKLLDHR
jgi:hypothetical protein